MLDAPMSEAIGSGLGEQKAAARLTVMLTVALLLPLSQRMFHFGPLHADDLAVTLAAGLTTIIILEFLKPLWHKRLMT